MTKPVIIIGGGLAGLYAGYLLKAQDVEFKILEASSRLGGRILGKPHSTGDHDQHGLDLGPTWFWPHQTALTALIKSLNIEIFEQYNRGEALFEADAHSPIERFMPSYMESMRVVGGMYRLIGRLAAELAGEVIELNYTVSSIRSTNGKWQIAGDHSDKAAIIADRVIIAAPPRVIVDKLEVTDENLEPLVEALEKVPTWMAAQAKFIASYKKPFWREQGLSGQAFSRLGPMVEIHDASSADNDSFAIFGFIGIAAVDRFTMTHDDLEQACLLQLAKIFGEQALDIEKCYLVDWAANQLIASIADINGRPEHPFIDLAPYRKTMTENGLYFGSAEVATQDPGYLHGAVVAASNAVEMLLSQ